MSSRSSDTIVFIPSPAAGHFFSSMELVKLLLDRDSRICVTVIILDVHPTHVNSITTTYTHSLSSHISSHRLCFIHLKLEEAILSSITSSSSPGFSLLLSLIIHHKKLVYDTVLSLGTSRIMAVILHMFCISFIDVAKDFSLPSYIFFTSGLTILHLGLHFNELSTGRDPSEIAALIDSDSTLSLPMFPDPVPTKLLPSSSTDLGPVNFFLALNKGLWKADGCLVNSFTALEPHAMASLSKESIPVYAVGPLISLQPVDGYGKEKEGDIMRWLDRQPSSSVAFLCFGSMGTLSDSQVKEVALGLERSGHSFLWSLRRSHGEEDEGGGSRGDDVAVEELPEGFLERTRGVGKVIGWAPQAAALAHPAVGGFVTHCGWNSTLESVWNGVPMVTWPMYAEQHMNAFMLARVMGVAEELTLDYKKGSSSCQVVPAEAVEKAVRRVMEEGGPVRRMAEVMSGEARKAVAAGGGSSHSALGCFIQDLTTVWKSLVM